MSDDLSLDDLHATSDVVWDYDVSADLAGKLDAAATAVSGQVGPRNSRKTTYGTEFRGYYAELWADNIETANQDARLLAERLGQVAQGVRDLEADARAEQARIDAAREWKRERDARSGLEKLGDKVDVLHLFHGDENPPKSEPVEQMVKTYEAPAGGERKQFEGTRSGTSTTSALPDDLRGFTSQERAATDEIRGTPAALRGLVADFRATCRWGQLGCDQVLTGFDNYITSNDNDCTRTDVVAANFEAAGGSGVISTVSDAAIGASLEANGVSERRPSLEIPAVQAVGNPPTSGYANDPVNTATGNFVENEEDLRFEGGTALLGWARSYSSLSGRTGGHGPGWASWDGCGLRFDSDGAVWTLADGREVVFGRLGAGFDRAEYDNFWLSAAEEGWVVTNNTGARWCFTSSGRPMLFSVNDGATVLFDYAGGRLRRIRHVRGHELVLEWDGDRIVAVRADDGRRVEYRYDGAGRLVEAAGPAGSRRYEWGEQGLIVAVIDADGVVEARNDYDERGRVVAQRSRFGRLTRFAYLPGRVTAVSDVDGGRSNTWVADGRGRLVAVTDCDGNRSRMAYDRWGNQVWAADPEGGQTVREFDARGRLVTEVVPTGAMRRLVWDEQDRLTEVISLEDGAEVARTSMAYEGAGQQPSVVTDGEGGRTRMVWDGGLLVEATDPTGVTVRFAYDGHGDLVASVDAEGNTTRIVRDSSGRPVEMISPSGAVTRYAYTPAGLLESRTDPDGARWCYEYSAGGRLTGVVDPLGARTGLEYGGHGELCATVDPLDRRVEQELDDLGNVSRVRLPDGAVWEYTHDGMSRLRQTVDPTGGVWQRHYDRFGRLAETVDPAGVRAFWRHDSARGEVTVGDAASASVVRMDRWGRQVETVGPDGSQVSTRYDRAGRPVEFTDAVGGRTLIERDPAGRPTRIRRPSGASVRYDYDACGRVAGVRNELGFRTRLDYDADSRLVAEHWPTGERGWTRYDACGRVTARHVPGSGTFRWSYDRAGRVVRARDPYNGVREFGYDAAGQLVTAVSGAGGTTRYGYDAAGRAVTITDPLGGLTRRTFDAMNRCTSQTDQLGGTAYASYDAAGRFIKNVDPDGRVIEIGYDETGRQAWLRADGRLVSRTTRDPRNRSRTIEDFTDPQRPLTHTLAYDPRGLLVRHDRGGACTGWDYDPDGLPVRVTAPGGAKTSLRRDAAGALVGVEHPGLATAVLERDPAGRLVRASASGMVHEWEFTDGFITRHTAAAGDGRARVQAMEHTGEGRLSAVTIDGERTRYRYDQAGQLIEAAGPDGARTWAYDPGGRLTRETIDDQTWERTHDAAGRLLKAACGHKTITYAHDRSGRRTAEEHSDGRRREYEWTGLWTLSAITDHSGDTVARTTTVVDALGQLSRVNDEEVFFDDLTGRLLQAGGQTITHAGPLTATVPGGWLEPSWRPGRDTDPQNPYQPPAAQTMLPGGLGLGPGGEARIAGTEWLGARVHDPASRGFLSPDPVEPTTGAGWAANPYSYAGNNPVNLYDPTGLHPITGQEMDAYRQANSPKWGTALAIVAGVALAFVPGAQGLGAALVAGAVLGGGASLIDQACTGYPIDWGQVGKDTLTGAAGGALGYGAGKGLQWAARTPAGQAVTDWAGRQTSRIPAVQRLTQNLGAKGAGQSTREAPPLTGDALDSVATPANASPTPQAPQFQGYEAEVRNSTSAARLPQDANVNPKPPPALDTNRPVSQSTTQNQWAQDRIR
ncbi:DUF6531 domain-containing protein, partial [Propionibacterium acidifaciens]